MIILDNKVGVNPSAQTDVADASFRVTAGGFGAVYLFGRVHRCRFHSRKPNL